VSFPDLRAVDRLRALDDLLGNPAWLHFVETAERAYAEAAIVGDTAEHRETSRRFVLLLRELRRRARDERRAAREGLGVDAPRDDT
jgi:hypothetical protein